jgi:hypothetical protein
MGAVLTPLGEPLSAIATAKLHGDFWRLGRLMWPWIIAGVLALGLAAYFGSQSRSSFDSARGDVTQLRRKDLNDQGATYARTANVLFGVAGVGLGAAAVVSLLDILNHRGAAAQGGK